MEFLAEGLGAISTMFALVMVVAGVMKLFQIHTLLTEIKSELQSGARSMAPAVSAAPVVTYAPVVPRPVATPPAATAPAAPVAAPPETAHLYSMGSGEEMLRALDAQMRAEEAQALTPEIIERS